MATNRACRTAARLLVLLLVGGFSYSGLAVLRGYRDIFRTAASSGPSASIDQYLVPVGLGSVAQLREAVARAGWAPGGDDRGDGEVMLMVEPSVLSRQDIVQTYYVTGYALYPRRIVLSRSPDPQAEAVKRGARRIIFIGRTNPFRSAVVEHVSELLALVYLQ